MLGSADPLLSLQWSPVLRLSSLWYAWAFWCLWLSSASFGSTPFIAASQELADLQGLPLTRRTLTSSGMTLLSPLLSILWSPTRTSRPVWQGWLVASKRKRTAVTRKQPTPPAVMRDASLRAPHTAIEAPTLPRERGLPWGDRHSGKKRENGILREERPRGEKELFIWSSPSISEPQEAPQELPSSFSLPLPWAALPLVYS